MMDMPPDWATKQALSLVAGEQGNNLDACRAAFARYIASKENPPKKEKPVAPDLLIAREGVSSALRRKGLYFQADQVSMGAVDSSPIVEGARAAIKLYKERNGA
jgi:hypothetical protein